MKYAYLRKLKKLYFSYLDLARVLNISEESARVSCSRYTDSGYFIRLKRNYYILRERWENLTIEEKFLIANILQVPSYVSLTTALAYQGYTTQIQQDFIESIEVHRTKEFQIEGTIFKYTKLKRKYYFGFIKKNNFFIALPEKALLDALYLMSQGRYRLDLSAVNWDKFNEKLILQWLKKYPIKNRKQWEKYARIKKTGNL